MSNYVQKQLLANEKVQYAATIHWAVFIVPCVYVLIALIVRAVVPVAGPYIGNFLLFIAALGFLAAYLNRASTELVITNKRVIAKFGFISRQTFEKHLNGLEGLNFHQGVLGRILGYGTIMVGGVGGTPIPVPYIDKPEAFKRELNQLIEDNQVPVAKAA
jgi:uncharacterized membrane protein YdbT with pleckstrin-like domain